MDSSEDNVKHAWTINNLRGSGSLSSSIFAVNGDSNIKFRMFLVSRRSINIAARLSSIGVRLHDPKRKGAVDVELDVNFWVEASDGRKSEIKRQRYIFKTHGDKCVFDLKPGIEYNIYNDAYMRGNPILTLHCELTPVPKISPQQPSIPKTLGQMLWTAYEEGVGHDMTIQVAKKEYKVSSLVLVSQSEVFKAMLSSNNFKEAQTKKLEIKDTTVPVMDAFIRYLYLGEVKNEKAIEGLFELSSKYMVTKLKSICEKMVRKSLSEENAPRRLILAIMHSDNDLKERILEFISGMGPAAIERIMQSKEWRDHLKMSEPSN